MYIGIKGSRTCSKEMKNLYALQDTIPPFWSLVGLFIFVYQSFTVVRINDIDIGSRFYGIKMEDGARYARKHLERWSYIILRMITKARPVCFAAANLVPLHTVT